MLLTDSMMSCLLAQVNDLFSFTFKFNHYSDKMIVKDYVCVILDKGTVLKVINVPKESWNNMEELLLEELEVFKVRTL